MGIALIHSKPYKPQGRGKIERFFRTVRMQFLPAFMGKTLDEINQALELWITEVYHQRKHSGIGQAPMKRFAEKMECIRPAPNDLEDYFRKRARRRVATDRTVSLNGKLYEAPVPLIGQQVTLLYHEHDPKRVEVRLQNRSHGFLAPLDLAVNARVKRNKHNLGELGGKSAKHSSGRKPVCERQKIKGGQIMKQNYRTFFALKKEPFAANITPDEIMQTPEVMGVAERFDYALSLGGLALVTGEVGSGKSTALRWAKSRLHPSEYHPLWITASAGSILELYRQLCSQLEIDTASSSRAVLTRTIKRQVREISTAQKKKLVLIIDEASLLRLDVFAELHAITQFDGDSKTASAHHSGRAE